MLGDVLELFLPVLLLVLLYYVYVGCACILGKLM